MVSEFKSAARVNILMVQLYNEYGMAMEAIFNSATIANTEPTQTSEPEPANRAERRATKRKTPLDIVGK